jgi:hypothetical protein
MMNVLTNKMLTYDMCAKIEDDILRDHMNNKFKRKNILKKKAPKQNKYNNKKYGKHVTRKVIYEKTEKLEC